MVDKRLLDRLAGVVLRLQRLRLWKGFALGWLVAAAVAALLVLTLNVPLLVTIPVGIVLAAGIAGWVSRSRPTDLRDAANLVEDSYPALDSRLLAAVDMRKQPFRDVEDEYPEYGFLQMRVLSDVLEHAHRQRWEQAVPRSRLLKAQGLQYVCFGLFALLVVWLGKVPQQVATTPKPASAAAPSADVVTRPVTVSPGDVEIEKGTGLLVTARFGGALPSSVELIARDASQRERRIPLAKHLSDPVFGGRIPEVRDDLEYRIVYDGDESQSYKVTTFEFPRLEQADAEIRFPTYTGRKDESIEDVRRVSIVEGSQLTLTCELNKPVAIAALAPKGGDGELRLEPVEGKSATMKVELSPTKTTTYRLMLTDTLGRAAKEPTEIVVSVVKNLPPDLKVAFPSRDVRVSPLQEVFLEGTASDDFGLQEHGLIYQTPDGSEKQLVLGAAELANVSVTMSHLLALEPLGVEPDNLVSYYFYADDIGPDGQTRRSFSDMFFAEVRPFEEIYRQAPSQQGQQQQQQQQQQGTPSQRILELQRQIVSASWNLIRHNPLDPPTATFREDSRTVADSQREAVSILTTMTDQMTDVAMKQFATEAQEHMEAAQKEFATSADKNSIEAMPEGRRRAQQAYQALLRLQAREHQVMNAQQSQQGQGQNQSQRLNQQLRSLELKNDRRRYETERQAQQQQSEQNREELQVLNRLRELARRQEDLNDRIRQAENALRNAKTDTEREEIERQLKRLQEEQQNLLRDVDELRDRMNREENRSRMTESREALDRTRERVQQSAEALRQQQTSQAIAEGTRAQRELEQLREDFRQRSAGQFDEAVRQLRNDVRELAGQQERLGRELRGESSDPMNADANNERRPRPSLRNTPATTPDRTGLADSFSEQQQKLDNLLQQARTLVEEAETAEPLLSQRLYEAIRRTRQDKPTEALAAASELLRRGFQQPAGEAEAQARDGINTFRTGVEQAAEGVLGDESSALRRAREELSMLTDAIGRELAENDAEFARNQQQHSDQQQREQQQGQRGSGEDQERRDSESREGTEGEASQQQNDSNRPGSDGQRTDPEEGSRGGSGRQQDEPSEQGSTARTLPGRQQQDRDAEGQSPGQQQPQGRGEPGQGQQEQSQQERGQPEGREGQQSGQRGQQPGQQGQQEPGQSAGEPSSSEQNPQSGQPSSSGQQGGRGGRQPSEALRSLTSGVQSVESSGGATGGPFNPLTGDQFLEFSDRLREVEEMVGNDELRAEAATIRERARQMRIEFKRHSTMPNWELVRTSIYGPMRELERRLSDEIARRSPEDRLVPIDRDAVPEEFAELVQRYYEELSRDRSKAGSDR